MSQKNKAKFNREFYSRTKKKYEYKWLLQEMDGEKLANFARAVTQRYWELGDKVWELLAHGFMFTPEQINTFRGLGTVEPDKANK